MTPFRRLAVGTALPQGTFVQQLLASLEDGEWHRVDELVPHPEFPHLGLEAAVRTLRSEGVPIDRRGEGLEASYRLARGETA
jgi:hypothetical protein